MATIYAATTNRGKLREFAECAQSAEAAEAEVNAAAAEVNAGSEAVEVLPLPGLVTMPVPVEDAATFMGNAELKAVAYSRALAATHGPGLLVMADDSGLEVDVLGGRPGVHSARFADEMGFGPEIEPALADVWPAMTKDTRNNLCLLSLLEQLPRVREGRNLWSGRFVCTLAVARDGEVLLRSEGSVAGEILDGPRGANGFGYDPLFLVTEFGLTMAELATEQKWEISHRGRAFRELLGQVASLDSGVR